MTEVTTKTCSRCGKTKPLEEFYKQATGRHGVCSHCKTCNYTRTVADRRPSHHPPLPTATSTGRPRIASVAVSSALDPFIVSFTREDVVDQYGNACFYCGDGAFEELDHHIAIAAGGTHTLANVRPSCTACATARTTPPTSATSKPCGVAERT